MQITKTERSTSIVTTIITYEVDEAEFNELVATGMNNEEAFDELHSNGKATATEYNCELEEVIAVHDSSVEI